MKIRIDDLSKLEITKVKPWAIFFKYDGVGYFIHECRDGYETNLVLYRRDLNEHGYWTLEFLMRKSYTDLNHANYFGKWRMGQPYSHIDKVRFVKALVAEGFSTGLYEAEYEQMLEDVFNLESELVALKMKITDRRREFWWD